MAGPIKGRADYWAPGDWNAACSECGRKRKASTMVRNWQGLYRCPEHNEPRQPQDFVKGAFDDQSVPWSQPEQDIQLYVCSVNGQSAIPGYATAGCSIPGNKHLDPYAPSDFPVIGCDEFGVQSLPAWAMPGCAIPGEDVFAP